MRAVEKVVPLRPLPDRVHIHHIEPGPYGPVRKLDPRQLIVRIREPLFDGDPLAGRSHDERKIRLIGSGSFQDDVGRRHSLTDSQNVDPIVVCDGVAAVPGVPEVGIVP